MIPQKSTLTYVTHAKNKIIIGINLKRILIKKNCHQALQSLSCAAKKYKMYLVINHREKVDCNGTKCPDDGLLIYNSNVVFDRTGQLIARYRKYNLFGEKGVNTESVANPSTFKTDLG